MDPNNYTLISPNLFRVQKFSSSFYVFRHHLETNVEEQNELKDTTWKSIRSVKKLEGAIKVRVNHIGAIVAIGEY
jgi:CRISPR-associated endonuclease Csn1